MGTEEDTFKALMKPNLFEMRELWHKRFEEYGFTGMTDFFKEHGWDAEKYAEVIFK